MRRFVVVRALRYVEIVETLPFPHFCFEIDVSFGAEKLVEFLSIRFVRSLDLANLAVAWRV